MIPTWGTIYQPVDQDDIIVRVQADLTDYYFVLIPGEPPVLTAQANVRSQDTTNDSFNFWKTK